MFTVVHAIIAFGKDLAVLIQLYIVLLLRPNPAIVEVVESWMRRNYVNLRFSDVTTTWIKKNIKASHTWILIEKWDDLMAEMGIQDPVCSTMVKHLRFVFTILYKWCFSTDEDKVEAAILAIFVK